MKTSMQELHDYFLETKLGDDHTWNIDLVIGVIKSKITQNRQEIVDAYNASTKDAFIEETMGVSADHKNGEDYLQKNYPNILTNY